MVMCLKASGVVCAIQGVLHNESSNKVMAKALTLFVILKSCVSLAEMGPRPQKKSTVVLMQEPRKEASPDWIGDGLVHSDSNPLPGWANSDFDTRRLMLAVVAQKIKPLSHPRYRSGRNPPIKYRKGRNPPAYLLLKRSATP